MRNFDQIAHAVGLKKFLESPAGTLYFDTLAPAPKMIVRHFDRELAPTLVRPFADLTLAAQRWVEARPPVAQWVTVEQPIEVGEDFIARAHHVYYQSLRSYDEPDEDDRVEVPEELPLMRAAVRAALGDSASIVEVVLARSLLSATGKTHLGSDRFIVVELSPTRSELESFSRFQ